MATEIIAKSDDEFVLKGANFLKDHIQSAIKSEGICLLGLSGGSTPKPIYQYLAKNFKNEIDWKKVYIFLVDDRYIEANHKDSNQVMMNESFISENILPHENILFPDPKLPLQECITQYEIQLKKLFDKIASKRAHIITLGLGEDGHIASLFPTLSDANRTTDKWVIYTTTDRFAVRDRISTTYQVLVPAQTAIFFLKGAAKKPVWDELITAFKSKDKKPEIYSRWPALPILEAGRTSALLFY